MRKPKRQPRLSACGQYAILPLANGLEALIDAEDIKKVAPHSWCCVPRWGGEFRACTRTKGKIVYLHRLLLDAPKGLEVDHINGCGLDNRRTNLRLATHSQNLKNQRSAKRLYKGVEQRSKNSWTATIWIDYKNIYIGSFRTPQLAALAYNQKATELHGEFARLNEVY